MTEKSAEKGEKGKKDLADCGKMLNFAGEMIIASFSTAQMQIQEAIAALENFAPLPLQEDYDNAGLQIGITGSKCSGVLLCLDVTEDVIAAAAERGCNLIVSHHPLLFRGLKRIGDEGYVERCVRRAIMNGITIYSAHTNLDNALGGVNFEIARRLGLSDVEFLDPHSSAIEGSKEEASGSGVIGRLPHPVPSMEFLAEVKRVFGVEALAYTRGPQTEIQTVALCGGSGAFLIDKAARKRADVFLTGELDYHRAFGYERSLWIAALGHYESERYTIDLLHRILAEACPTLKIEDYTESTSPIRFI